MFKSIIMRGINPKVLVSSSAAFVWESIFVIVAKNKVHCRTNSEESDECRYNDCSNYFTVQV